MCTYLSYFLTHISHASPLSPHFLPSPPPQPSQYPYHCQCPSLLLHPTYFSQHSFSTPIRTSPSRSSVIANRSFDFVPLNIPDFDLRKSPASRRFPPHKMMIVFHTCRQNKEIILVKHFFPAKQAQNRLPAGFSNPQC
jgi:hypothetical protein